MNLTLSDGNRPSNDQICRALNDTRLNWSVWKSCYENNGDFGYLPVFADDIIFQGFVYEYSVARGLQLHQVRAIRSHLKGWTLPTDKPAIVALNDEIRATVRSTPKRWDGEIKVPKGKPSDEWERVSMASKLLALWRPQQFPMWDQYAPRGLSRLHGRTRGHSYSAKSIDTYDQLYVPDFKSLLNQYRAEINRHLSPNEQTLPGFAERFFDNILLRLGRFKPPTPPAPPPRLPPPQ